jgi:hypothetical protein
MVTVISSSGMKKERCIFLFSDLAIITSYKRRGNNMSKKSNTIILSSPVGKQYLETVKHKFIARFQLEDIDLSGQSTRFVKKTFIINSVMLMG